MDDFSGRLDAAMAARNIGVRGLARRVHCDPGLISRLRSGKQQPSPNIARLLDEELGAAGTLTAAGRTAPARPDTVAGDEIAAIEVVRRTAASDVGEATVGELERITDGMALAYPRTPPDQLLTRVRTHLAYASGLLARRTTLNEHRRLLVTSGWLSLLASTCLIDLRRFPSASAYLRTATELARETGDREIAAWCLETKAWQVLTDGDYPHAAVYAQAAQRTAPQDGSAYIQATGQEAARGPGSARRGKPARLWPGRRPSSPRCRCRTARSTTTSTTPQSLTHTRPRLSPGSATLRQRDMREASSAGWNQAPTAPSGPGGQRQPGWTWRSRSPRQTSWTRLRTRPSPRSRPACSSRRTTGGPRRSSR